MKVIQHAAKDTWRHLVLVKNKLKVKMDFSKNTELCHSVIFSDKMQSFILSTTAFWLCAVLRVCFTITFHMSASSFLLFSCVTNVF